MSSPTTWVSEVLDAVSLRPGSPIRQPSGSSSAVVVVELPPRSVVVVRMPLQAAPMLLPTSERHEYFAKDVMAKAGCVASSCADPGACLHCNGRGGDRIKFETAITMPAAAAAANKGGRVWLRLGLHGDGVMCPAWAVTLTSSSSNSSSGSGSSSSSSSSSGSSGSGSISSGGSSGCGERHSYTSTTVFEPTAEFRAGGCAANTQNCSASGLRTPRDGYQNSYAEIELSN